MLFLLPTLNPRVCCWNVCAQKSVEKKTPTKNMWCKLFSSLRTKLNDDEIYYDEHYYIYDTTTTTRLIIMVATLMMMMMMNCDSCCLTVPLTILLTGAQVKNLINQHQKKKKEKSLNKPLRAAWPSFVCSGPVSHVLFWCPSQSSCWTFVVLFPNFHL